ncbi:MAG: hemolysin family protein [Patescibacteria group bacterium]|nr:hemolysin family protein [Patescibacteria group bacterium]
MIPDPAFWLAVFGLALTCLAAVGSRSLVEFGPHELKEVCHRHGAPDRLGQILRRHDHVALAAETLQVVGTAVFVGAYCFWTWVEPHSASLPNTVLGASSLAVGALALLAAEIWIPWAVVRLWAEPFLYHTWPAWQLLYYALLPLVTAASVVDTMMHRLAGRPLEEPTEESFEEDILAIVSEGHREGLLEEDAREMIEGIIELRDADVSEIMTPRTDMVAIPKSLAWDELLDFIVHSAHTRIPVTDKSRDDIIGLLVTKDLLPELAKAPGLPRRPWAELLREPFFVPETKPIDALLQEFQRTRSHMAIVLDEYGGVSGLVTMEDVLEQIVGEIVDEYDPDLIDGIHMLDDGVCEALGKVHIDEVNERLSLHLPDDRDFDTIGGLVFSELGHIPAVGEELLWGNVRITVIEATRRRIERVRIEVLDHPRAETG